MQNHFCPRHGGWPTSDTPKRIGRPILLTPAIRIANTPKSDPFRPARGFFVRAEGMRITGFLVGKVAIIVRWPPLAAMVRCMVDRRGSMRKFSQGHAPPHLGQSSSNCAICIHQPGCPSGQGMKFDTGSWICETHDCCRFGG
jgi:hypothetical protein